MNKETVPTPPTPCCSQCSPRGVGGPSTGHPSRVFVGAPTLSVQRSGVASSASGAFLKDAFRPFYLGGAIFAVLAIPLWLGSWYHGYFPPTLQPLLWHTHEMVFGFAGAIIVGFLFTAARNWTGLPLPAGMPLAIIFGLWVAARVGMYFAYGPTTALIDSAVLFIVACVLAFKFIRARSTRSMPLVVVLFLLGVANATFHAAALGRASLSPLTVAEAGLMLIVLIELIVGGRVVPGFTANAFPGIWQFRSLPLHVSCFVLTALAFASDLCGVQPIVAAVLAWMAAAAVLTQAIGWNPIAARSRPMILTLHLAHAWIPVGLVLFGLSAVGVVSRSTAIHALAVGSMAGLIMSMITRTSLGHSGRPIRAGRREISMFVLIQLAATLRVIAALVPAFYLWGVASSGLAWCLAFALFVVTYSPILVGKRPKASIPCSGLAVSTS